MSKVIGQALESARAKHRAAIAEAENQKLMAILEYVAMMADVDIDQVEGENAQQDV